MRDKIKERVIKEAKMLMRLYKEDEEAANIRRVAALLDVSKSTVHKDLSQRLSSLDSHMYEETQKIIQKNKRERHYRGGRATKERYLSVKRKRGFIHV